MRKVKVGKYGAPKYPKKDFYAQHPELLVSSLPARWLKNKAAAGALITFILGGASACDSGLPEERTFAELEKELKPSKEDKRERIKIAPLFIHGSGMGATGCVVVSPPVFLSEAEAWDVILSELKKENLHFRKRTRRVDKIFTEERSMSYSENGGFYSYQVMSRSPLYLDAFNPELNLGLKFIGHENYFDLGGIDSRSTVARFELTELAKELAEKMKAKGGINAAFFYDPMTRYDSHASIAEIRDTSRQELREQVREFIKWLDSEFPRNPAAIKTAQ